MCETSERDKEVSIRNQIVQEISGCNKLVGVTNKSQWQVELCAK